jgi:hypothetical protein
VAHAEAEGGRDGCSEEEVALAGAEGAVEGAPEPARGAGDEGLGERGCRGGGEVGDELAEECIDEAGGAGLDGLGGVDGVGDDGGGRGPGAEGELVGGGPEEGAEGRGEGGLGAEPDQASVEVTSGAEGAVDQVGEGSAFAGGELGVAIDLGAEGGGGEGVFFEDPAEDRGGEQSWGEVHEGKAGGARLNRRAP